MWLSQAAVQRPVTIFLLVMMGIAILSFAVQKFSVVAMSRLCDPLTSNIGNGAFVTLDGSICHGRTLMLQVTLVSSSGSQREMRLPFSYLEDREQYFLGQHRVAALRFPIKNYGPSLESSFYDSFVVLKAVDTNGEGVNNNKFFDDNRYRLIQEIEGFYEFEQYPTKVSWVYLVPRTENSPGVYLRCSRNCSMYGNYRGIYYEMYFPHLWKNEYATMRDLLHGVLEFGLKEENN